MAASMRWCGPNSPPFFKKDLNILWEKPLNIVKPGCCVQIQGSSSSSSSPHASSPKSPGLEFFLSVEGFSKLKNWLVVCHCQEPEHVELGLGLLLSEQSEEPWKGKLIGGEEDEPDRIQGDHDLKSKCELIMWKCSVLGAFDLILEVGVNANLKAEQMIK
ncbi:uncharacterized protein Pyn_29967 [Prunus yedoensis var. nudiflora]|uniref:DUF7788 domain-containing protein n=1 Tax=Prunus yedoensis var. nudiflora TaxID=2094558 RepID=A0A314Z033_PRUYE|nr:uncharacterized protein Pyn_29967 [Prunus yedoensis var. nudiflora]